MKMSCQNAGDPLTIECFIFSLISIVELYMLLCPYHLIFGYKIQNFYDGFDIGVSDYGAGWSGISVDD